jgi:hypothetical protein
MSNIEIHQLSDVLGFPLCYIVIRIVTVHIPMKSSTSSGHVVHPSEQSDASVHII